MNGTCHVAVGMKFGDLCSVLPVLLDNFKRTGQKQILMVADKYKSLLEGCSYVQPVIYGGAWHDLRGAVREAKSRFTDTVILSTFGESLKPEQNLPSFQLDQWHRAGRLSDFGNLPLAFDFRDLMRERALTAKIAKPCILFADVSESSPFEHGDDLLKFIQTNFPKHNVVRLSHILADKVYDLVGLYDSADALVTTETIHAHLSHASKIPTIVLATDKPTRWHGCAYRGQILHVRYCDYEQRKPEIVRALREALEKSQAPTVNILRGDGYNPSMIEFEGVTLTVFRYHPNPNHWRTQLKVKDGGEIIPPDSFKDYSLEDGRLFLFNGKIHGSYTCARTVNGAHRCVVQYAELNKSDDGWRLEKVQQPAYAGNDFSGLQKNWSFWAHNEKLYAAINRSPEQIVVQIEGSKIVKEFRTKTPEWNIGQMRGGTHPIPYRGLWLQFFHTQRQLRSGAQWVVGALLMETQPPFQIMSVSSHPILSGNEKYFPGSKFWKPNVSIVYGAIKTDAGFRLSLGWNDSVCAIADVSDKQLNL